MGRMEGGGVVVAVLGSASCSACSGSIRPEPKLSLRSPVPSRLALICRMRRMSAGVSLGLRSSKSATMPLTSAAATEIEAERQRNQHRAALSVRRRTHRHGYDQLPRLAVEDLLHRAAVERLAITRAFHPPCGRRAVGGLLR